MALIECPDCGRKVSDRADHCPDCHCPVAEVVAEQKAAERQRSLIESRKGLDREVDCPRCDARGLFKLEDGSGHAQWCPVCEATGRVSLCEAADGYYAVATYAVERFVAGEVHAESSGVVFRIGRVAPSAFRYPSPSARIPVQPEDIPWEAEEP